MFKELEFRWRQWRLSRQYAPLIERELDARRREEIWWEYSDEYNELSIQRKIYQDGRLQRTADQMRLPVPAMRDGAGSLTASWEEDCAGRPFLRAEAFCELRKRVRDEYWAQRGVLIQWISIILKIRNILIFTASLLFLNTSISYGETPDEYINRHFETLRKAEEKASQDEIDKVEVIVKYDRETCRAQEEPHGNAFQMLAAEKKALLISIHNRSKHTSAKVKWSLTVRRKGHSDDLTDYHELPPNQQLEFKRSNAFANDKILLPGESDEQCYDLPHMSGGYSPEDLVYSVKSKTVVFMK